MIENLDELLVQAQGALDKTTAVGEKILDKSFSTYDESDPLGKQIKDIETDSETIQGFLAELNDAYNTLNHILGVEIQQVYQANLVEKRQRYLEEETDTPREAAENIEAVLPMVGDEAMRGKLQAALKYLMTQVPPTVEEVEEIPFETARVDDSKLPVGTEVVEREGVNGEVKVVYEVNKNGEEETRVEVERTVIKEPVMELVRVGTKVDEI